ncbi:MAG: hypothetical protein DRK00_07500, partial [Thermoprotei archaeon]
MPLLTRGVREALAKRLGVSEDRVEDELNTAVEDVANMVRRFVWAGQYSFADRLANAASREAVTATLYEMLRISKSALDAGRTLDEDVKPYVAREESVKLLLDLMDLDLIAGLEAARRAAVLA